MQVECKTGFWLSADMETSLKYDTFEDLGGYSAQPPIDSAWKFLQGSCLIFALNLHKIFGYEIRIAWDAPFLDRTENIWDTPAISRTDAPKSFWEHLVHGYCVAELDGRTAYIDIRGITTERQPFFDAFADRFHPCPFEEPKIDPAGLEKFLSTDEQNREVFFLAEKLITERKGDYTLPQSHQE